MILTSLGVGGGRHSDDRSRDGDATILDQEQQMIRDSVRAVAAWPLAPNADGNIT